VPGAAKDDGDAPTIIEVGCWAHVRRKFFELHVAAKSTLAEVALAHIGALYAVERAIHDEGLDVKLATVRRQQDSKPRLLALHAWLLAQRQLLTDGTGTAKTMDYCLKRWPALIRYADDGRLPMDNNRIENQIRPWAIGRNNANGRLMRTRLRRRAIPPSVEAPTASRLLRIITATAGTASNPWAGGSELA